MIIVNDRGFTDREPQITEYIVPTLRAESHGNLPKIIEQKSDGMQHLEPRKDGISNTLTTVQKDNLVLENTVKIRQATKEPAEFELGGVFNASYPGSNTRRGRVIDKGATSPTATAAGEAGGIVQMNREYRIRKLTPRECGRLMGVDDEDIDKMEKVNSNTQLYKQFGNSIVVDVMCYMFQNLNIHINEASKHEEIGYDCV